MNIPTRLAGLAAGVMMFASCQPPAARFTTEDQVTLRALFDSTAREVSSGRWDTWAGHYAEDATIQPPNAPAVNGRAAILAWGEAFPPIESLTVSDVQVSGEGNLAYATCAYALKLTGLPLDTGKELVVFRRPAGGAWQVQAVSFSSDLPPAVPPPANARPM